jgi:uncharacterized protein
VTVHRAKRALVWRGTDAYRTEYADVHLHSDHLLARGVQIGVDPRPYYARYSLDTREGFETARLTVDVSGDDWSRRLDLRRDPDGAWHVSGDFAGADEMPPPGCRPSVLEGAVDCDIAFSPLTNTMPILRNELHEGGAPVDYEMAWVSLPDLAVHRSLQRYEPIAPGRVRYVSRDSDFRAELELDDDGLLVRYEHLAERVSA